MAQSAIAQQGEKARRQTDEAEGVTPPSEAGGDEVYDAVNLQWFSFEFATVICMNPSVTATSG